jgi:aspartate kinase
MMVSTGERVAMALLSIAIHARGHRAISFTGSQCGIITNDRHFDARIIEVRPHRIEDELARGNIVIVAGYQGVSYRREITTLGRGGSDTTAVALAAALGAERCEIYSDVDGVYSADPRVVPDAEHLPEVDHMTLQVMAESGAKVLCAQAVEWARRAGIAIYARATFDAPSDEPKQTVVRMFGPAEQPRARAVVADCRIVLARLPAAPDAADLEPLLRAFAQLGLSVRELTNDARGTTMILSVLNAPQWQATRLDLERQAPALTIEEGVGLVSVCGGGLTDEPASLLEFRAIVAAAGGAPLLLLASPLRLGAVVPAATVEPAQRALHSRFVEQPGPR